MELQSTCEKNTLTVSICGDIDEHSSAEIRTYIDKAITQSRFADMVLDFTGVDFMDSTGIGMILGRYKRLKNNGKTMCVKNVSPQIDKVFKVSGLYQIIKAV